MTVYLLDVNILIPLVHPTHEFALAAKTWFDRASLIPGGTDALELISP